MRIGLVVGSDRMEVDVPADRLIEVRRSATIASAVEPLGAVANALENPTDFPSLRRALTPDDHIVLVFDEKAALFPELLLPILEHLQRAEIKREAITLLFPNAKTHEEWKSVAGEGLLDLATEVHDPTDREKLSYLATTHKGRRLYLNRTLVDADQLVVISYTQLDSVAGCKGAEGIFFPTYSDEASLQERAQHLSSEVFGSKSRPWTKDASEAAWLLGAPFFLHVVEGAGDEIIHIVGGLIGTSSRANCLLEERWSVEVDEPADTVIGTMEGKPAHQTFSDLAKALGCCARVVKPQGRVVLLTQASPMLGEGASLIRQADEPERAVKLLRKSNPIDLVASLQWVGSVQEASVYLLSQWEPEVAEELFTVPIENVAQVQRLFDTKGSCLVLPDAHKTRAVVRER